MLGGILGGLIQSGSSKRDRSETLQSYGDLSNVFNFALPAATAQQSAGASNLQKSGDYYSKLLSGNRPAVLSAIAPQTSAINAATDAEKKQIATSGTARGGGTASVGQSINDKKMAQIDQLLFGARADAAKGAESVGAAQVADAANLLGVGEASAGTIGDLSLGARKQNLQVTQNTVNAASNAIMQALAAFA